MSWPKQKGSVCIRDYVFCLPVAAREPTPLPRMGALTALGSVMSMEMVF